MKAAKLLAGTILFASLLASCKGQEPEEKEVIEKNITKDSVVNIVIDEDTLPPINENIKKLLNNPLDLAAYKQEWGTSNSGIPRTPNEIYRPDTAGFFYRYMLFYKLNRELNEPKPETDLFNDFQIYTYKYGDEVGNFYDTNEELIAIKSKLDNTTLGEINWFGKKEIELLDFYGTPQYQTENCFIYQFENKVMSAHFENNKVDWYKYIKIDPSIKLDESIPECLYEF
ncbi:hypothetical protein K6119_03440 [Paracrocinitomix mangrovi]|uniref:hypothetical protein n=1 Tax=Paracrocinitomix mangrovi TaxID=2862509 RepID=UPI001C8D4EDB|nr:hypothetical protein [Paracrocinitomix mangrovi]UKN02569.1 hypothetical protein K6119_03440 [Paracrocinitomix mangrovi]